MSNQEEKTNQALTQQEQNILKSLDFFIDYLNEEQKKKKKDVLKPVRDKIKRLVDVEKNKKMKNQKQLSKQ